jgi:regulator of protease activity HflC (stomatin/prohibitin superfamily)
MPISGFAIFAIVLVLFAVVTLIAGVKQVPQGYNYTVERFGRYARTLEPGLGLIVPYVEMIGKKINMMEQVIDVPSQEVITRDNASVVVDGVAFFTVLNAAQASYEVSNLQQAILTVTMTNIRTVMGSMDLDQLLSHRDEINERLLRTIDAAASPWGVKINRIEIKDIVPPKNLVDSMNRQMMAEREKRAVVLEAEGQRQAEVLRAEGHKTAQILEAEGRKEAAFRDAEARERSAEAEARATQMVSTAIAEGDMGAINYFVAQQYVKALQAIASAPNQKVLMMPLEASSLIGTIAGIAEIARSAGGGDGPGPKHGGGSRTPEGGTRSAMAQAISRPASQASGPSPSTSAGPLPGGSFLGASSSGSSSPGTPPAGPWGAVNG